MNPAAASARIFPDRRIERRLLSGEFLLFAAAAAMLLLLLGRNALIGVEGECAAAAQLIAEKEAAAGANANAAWHSVPSAEVLFASLPGLLGQYVGISEQTLRLIPALLALAALGGTLSLTRRTAGRDYVLAAGWLLIGSYGFLFWGRTASGAIAAAAAGSWLASLLYGQRKKDAGFGHFFAAVMLILWTLLFAGGPAAAAMLLLALPALKKTAGYRQLIALAAAVLLAAGVTFLLLLPLTAEVMHGKASAITPSATLRFLAELLIREGNELLFPDPLQWTHQLVNLPRLLLPWTLLTIVALAGIGKNFRSLPDPLRRLTAGGLAVFLLLGLWPGRRWSVLLPLLGPMFTLTAVGLNEKYSFRSWHLPAELVMRFWVIICASLAVAVPVTWPLWPMLLRIQPPLFIMLLLPVLGLTALGILLVNRHRFTRKSRPGEFALTGTIPAGAAVMAALLCVLQPELTDLRSGRTFWRQCRSEIRRQLPERVFFYRCGPGAIPFYYIGGINSGRLHSAETTAELSEQLTRGSGHKFAIIARRDKEAEVSALLRRQFGGNPSPRFIEKQLRHWNWTAGNGGNSDADAYEFWLCP